MKKCKMEELAGVLLTCGYHARQIQQIVDEAREGGKTGEEQETLLSSRCKPMWNSPLSAKG